MSIYSQIPKLNVTTELVVKEDLLKEQLNRLENDEQDVTKEDDLITDEKDEFVEKNYDFILKSYENPIALSTKLKNKTIVSFNNNLKDFINYISENEFENGYLSQKDLIKILQLKVEKDSGVKFNQSKSKEIFNKLNFNFKSRKRNSSVSINFEF